MPKPKLVVAARVSPDVRDRLKALSRRKRQSISDLVSEALSRYIESQR